jgi:hypothetical protein
VVKGWTIGGSDTRILSSSKRLDGLWGPLSFLFIGNYALLSVIKRPEREANRLFLSG